ncbi:MAG: DUF4834 family protein [Prevotellaceae bacterium]|jgi:uncharacterized protein YxeA|nr:DUF4834 family protein [Prevotellaceae bacterium]
MNILLIILTVLAIIIFAVNTVFVLIAKVINGVSAIFRGSKRSAKKSDTENTSKRADSNPQTKKVFSKNEGEYVDFEDIT